PQLRRCLYTTGGWEVRSREEPDAAGGHSVNIQLSDLVLAWRKAKVDLYYSTNPPLFEMANYEENLIDNLEKLAGLINSKSKKWVTEPNFLGPWTLAPKAISFNKDSTDSKSDAEQQEENDTA